MSVIKVLIIDDSAVVRQVLTATLGQEIGRASCRDRVFESV